jgi:hypothetical protein
LLACQPVLLQEQFDHALALLLDLLVSFAHNCMSFDDLCRKDTKHLAFFRHSVRKSTKFNAPPSIIKKNVRNEGGLV